MILRFEIRYSAVRCSAQLLAKKTASLIEKETKRAANLLTAKLIFLQLTTHNRPHT
jgi:hypothetical protein